jgi:hypothetical protein
LTDLHLQVATDSPACECCGCGCSKAAAQTKTKQKRKSMIKHSHIAMSLISACSLLLGAQAAKAQTNTLLANQFVAM